MFVDEVTLEVNAGSGGDGCMAFRREKYIAMGGPFGGNGGRGGNIIFKVEPGLKTLVDLRYQKKIKGKSGANGEGKNKHGKGAEDTIIKVPLGTTIKDADTNVIIADLTKNEEDVIVAYGGRGGRGNVNLSTKSNPCPSYAEKGEPGEVRNIKVELRMLADVGLVGMPSVGKSTIISKLSASKPKIADYPFTTLVPNLGVVKKPHGDGFVVADIPGLIEGASDGLGLGHEFLRHVQRCKLLLHIVDVSNENCFENYLKINEELKKFDENLASRYSVIVLNKTDLIDEESALKLKYEFQNKTHSNDVFIISAITHFGLKELLDFLYIKLEEVEEVKIPIDIEQDADSTNNDDSDFEVSKINRNTFLVDGGKLRRLASVTDVRNGAQMKRFENILDSMGVFEALRNKGIKDNDTIVVSGIEITFLEDYF